MSARDPPNIPTPAVYTQNEAFVCMDTSDRIKLYATDGRVGADIEKSQKHGHNIIHESQILIESHKNYKGFLLSPMRCRIMHSRESSYC